MMRLLLLSKPSSWQYTVFFVVHLSSLRRWCYGGCFLFASLLLDTESCDPHLGLIWCRPLATTDNPMLSGTFSAPPGVESDQVSAALAEFSKGSPKTQRTKTCFTLDPVDHRRRHAMPFFTAKTGTASVTFSPPQGSIGSR